MGSENDGGAGARGIRYAGSVAGVKGELYEVRLEESLSVLMEATEGGRDGKSCDKRSEVDRC